MSASEHPPLSLRRVSVGLALTGVGGFVDCFSYLTLSKVYAATMSGNTVLVAVQGGSGDSGGALLHAYTIAVFLAGLLLSSVAIELGLRRGHRRVLALALAIEVACLTALLIFRPARGEAPLLLLLALAAVAMGIQNTSLRMSGILAIFTTHVTGTLTRLGEQLASALSARAGAPRDSALRQAGFSAALWLAFFAGALVASELLPLLGSAALWLPIAGLIAVIAADLRQPFAPAKPA
jgi:uncharacterized membrane protein YoaK (UPF0700 family)